MTGRPLRSPAWAEFARLWVSLREASVAPGTTVVVEGERDARSLNRLGLNGPIARVHQGRPLSHLAHELGEGRERVILLTDWDGRGGLLARRLKGFLEAGHARVDLDFRRRLAVVLRGEIVHVEGLAGWAGRAARESGVRLEEWLEETAPESARE